ncbi:unnamed protein product, partial [Staurois parvus]
RQTASTNICERKGHSQNLSEFKRGPEIGCQLCNKSFREIILLLNIPRSTVTDIVTNNSAMNKCNAKRRIQWCKVRHHWTLEQWKHILWSDQLRFSVWV